VCFITHEYSNLQVHKFHICSEKVLVSETLQIPLKSPMLQTLCLILNEMVYNQTTEMGNPLTSAQVFQPYYYLNCTKFTWHSHGSHARLFTTVETEGETPLCSSGPYGVHIRGVPLYLNKKCETIVSLSREETCKLDDLWCFWSRNHVLVY